MAGEANEPGTVLTSSSRSIPLDAWGALKAAVDAAGLWVDAPAKGCAGVDGSLWLLEGVRQGARAVAHRWSPKEGPFRAAGLLFLSLADIVPERIY